MSTVNKPKHVVTAEWDSLNPAEQLQLAESLALADLGDASAVRKYATTWIANKLAARVAETAVPPTKTEVPRSETPEAAPARRTNIKGDGDKAKALTVLFDKINGLDTYQPSEVYDEMLPSSKFMLLTADLARAAHVNTVEQVGVQQQWTAMDYLYIAALNAQHLKEINHPHYIRVGLLRALIAGRGFLPQLRLPVLTDGVTYHARNCFKDEIKIVEAAPKGWDDDDVDAFTDVSAEVRDEYLKYDADYLTGLAILIPTFTALQFEKTNHHYPKGAEAKESHLRHFRSSLIEDIAPTWNHQDLVYDSVHWLGPFNEHLWYVNNNRNGKLPRGMTIKINPAPAGTAVIMTQLAIWDQVDIFPGSLELSKLYEQDIKNMRDAAILIERDPLSYHIFAKLYNKNCLLDSEPIAKAMKSAALLSAIGQAFIDTIAKGTDIARARALKKHADNNISLYKLASAGFRGSLRRITRDAINKTLVEAIAPTFQKAQQLAQNIPVGGAVPLPPIEELED